MDGWRAGEGSEGEGWSPPLIWWRQEAGRKNQLSRAVMDGIDFASRIKPPHYRQWRSLLCKTGSGFQPQSSTEVSEKSAKKEARLCANLTGLEFQNANGKKRSSIFFFQLCFFVLLFLFLALFYFLKREMLGWGEVVLVHWDFFQFAGLIVAII